MRYFNFTYLLLISCLGFLIGCSSSEEAGASSGPDEPLQGDWHVVKFKYDDCPGSQLNGIERDHYQMNLCEAGDDDPCTYFKWTFLESEVTWETNSLFEGKVEPISVSNFLYTEGEGKFCLYIDEALDCTEEGYKVDISGKIMTMSLESHQSTSGCRHTWTLQKG